MKECYPEIKIRILDKTVVYALRQSMATYVMMEALADIGGTPAEHPQYSPSLPHMILGKF
jgi:hypothetical protein